MKNIPRYNSKRRESPYSRILKNLQEKINKKAKSKLKSSKNLNINQNFTNIPISINYNIQISSTKIKVSCIIIIQAKIIHGMKYLQKK